MLNPYPQNMLEKIKPIYPFIQKKNNNNSNQVTEEHKPADGYNSF
jgi:hypothetical protein